LKSLYYDARSEKHQINNVVYYLLLRLHVSALVLGHQRPDDGPVQWPKHVVLAINTTPHY